MTTQELEILRNRWTPELSSVGIRSLMGKSEPPFPNLLNGLRDLRGLTISSFMKGISIAETDLSGCVTKGFGQFGMCRVLKCSFLDAEITTNLGNDFETCDFTAATLTSVVLRGQFVDCNFTAANFSSAKGDQVKFKGCNFAKSNFRKATLTHCLFETCEFAQAKFGSGSLASSKFVNSPFDLADLANTLLENTIVSK
jgi:uncharacterized protein YjbI with pentapeptide repeats